MGLRPLIAFGLACGSLMLLSPQVSAETREQYLARLKTICEVECLQPRQFQRTARKRKAGDDSDMAIIMDVAFVAQVGSMFVLYDRNLERSALETLDILGSAGVNTSGSNGVGGLPRGGRPPSHPNVIVIELDGQALADLIGPIQSSAVQGVTGQAAGEIIVDEQRNRKVERPGLDEARNFLLNRRIVVRGKPRLDVTIIGARRDFHRKQVVLEVRNADDLVRLPRYDEDGQPIYGGEFEVVDAPAP